jgi:hypothetical protein
VTSSVNRMRRKTPGAGCSSGNIPALGKRRRGEEREPVSGKPRIVGDRRRRRGARSEPKRVVDRATRLQLLGHGLYSPAYEAPVFDVALSIRRDSGEPATRSRSC